MSHGIENPILGVMSALATNLNESFRFSRPTEAPRWVVALLD